MNRRLGKFLIPLRQIEYKPEVVAHLFREAECVVVSCIFKYDRQAVEYIAMSPKFERIERGLDAPDYGILTVVEEIVTKVDGVRSSKEIMHLHFLGMGEPDAHEVIPYEERKEESREETEKDFPPEIALAP